MSFTSSPAMKPELFVGQGSWADDLRKPTTMTISGTVNKSMILLLLCVLTGAGSWMLITSNPAMMMPVFFGSMIVGLILSFVLMFAPKSAPITAPIYAIAEGGFLGAISLIYSMQMAGTKVGGATGSMVVANAALITLCILGAMLALYKLRIINATGKFKAIMATIGVGILLYSLVVFALSMFGVNVGVLYQGPLGILIAGGILIYSAFSLILNFDMIEQGAEHGAPKYMEWYSGFALLMTLVWIYLNVLRLLSILSKRN